MEDLALLALDGDNIIALPTTAIHKPIPNAIDEVPHLQEVAHFPHLGDLPKHFPDKDPSWSTLLNLERDCIIAQLQEQYTAYTN